MARGPYPRDGYRARWLKKGSGKNKIRELLLADTREIAGLLAQKANPEETAEYKDWAMAMAGNVAIAAHETGHAMQDAEGFILVVCGH